MLDLTYDSMPGSLVNVGYSYSEGNDTFGIVISNVRIPPILPVFDLFGRTNDHDITVLLPSLTLRTVRLYGLHA